MTGNFSTAARFKQLGEQTELSLDEENDFPLTHTLVVPFTPWNIARHLGFHSRASERIRDVSPILTNCCCVMFIARVQGGQYPCLASENQP